MPTGSEDEIGRLAEAFVTMTQDLEAREREKERPPTLLAKIRDYGIEGQ